MLLRKEKFHHVIPRATWRVRKEKNHLHCKPFCLLFSYDGAALLGLWKWRIQTRLFNFRLPTCALHLSCFRRVSVRFKIPHTNHQGSKPQSRGIIRSPAKAGWGEGRGARAGGKGGGRGTKPSHVSFCCCFLNKAAIGLAQSDKCLTINLNINGW